MSAIDTRIDWRDAAACRKEDPDLWFPNGKGMLASHQYELARQICSACPVIRDCDQWARAVRPEFGMVAGLTPEQRRVRHGAPITAVHGGKGAFWAGVS